MIKPTNIFNTVLIEESNFHNAWASSLYHILKDGIQIRASEGSPTMTLEKTVVIDMNYEAIKQIENMETHPRCPFGSKSTEAYEYEFTYEFVEKHNKLPLDKQFAYLYMDRFINYPHVVAAGDNVITHIDQLAMLATIIREDGISRRHQIITWIPWKDMTAENPPCLQRVQVRALETKEQSEGDVIPLEAQFDWRSRDFYGGWQLNKIGLVGMLNRYVCKDEFELVRIVDISKSGHIYENDIDKAKLVKKVPVF